MPDTKLSSGGVGLGTDEPNPADTSSILSSTAAGRPQDQEKQKRPKKKEPTAAPARSSASSSSSSSSSLSVLAVADAFLARLGRCTATPAGIDTFAMLLSYTARAGGHGLSALIRRHTKSDNNSNINDSKKASPGGGVMRGSPTPIPALEAVASRLKALSGLMGEARMLLRLWGLLGMYFWARGLSVKTWAALRGRLRGGGGGGGSTAAARARAQGRSAASVANSNSSSSGDGGGGSKSSMRSSPLTPSSGGAATATGTGTDSTLVPSASASARGARALAEKRRGSYDENDGDNDDEGDGHGSKTRQGGGGGEGEGEGENDDNDGQQRQPAESGVDLAIAWVELASLTAYYGLENGAFLSSKGVLGWSAPRQARAYRWSCRFWAAYVGIQLGRLGAEALAKKGDETKEKDTTGENNKDWLSKWGKDVARNLAFAPLTAHWSIEGGLVGELWVGLLGTVPAVINIRELWIKSA